MIGLAIDLNHELLCHIGDRGVIETHVVEIVILNVDITGVQQITSHDHSSGDRTSEVCRREEVSSTKTVIIAGAVIDRPRIKPHLIHDREALNFEGGELESGRCGDGERGAALHCKERISILIIDRDRAATDQDIKVTIGTA